MPKGLAEAGYFRPGSPDGPHDLLTPTILRRIPPDLLDRYAGRHRVALWAQIPRAPFALLGPLLRHELEHAAQWQRYGRPFINLNDELREAWEVETRPGRYRQLPSERAANLAAAKYASNYLPPVTIARLRRSRRYRQFVDQSAVPLEDDVLALTVGALRAAVVDTESPAAEPGADAIQHLEEAARSWPSDALERMRDDQLDMVVTRPFRA